MKVLIRNYIETNETIEMDIKIEQEKSYHGYENSLGFTKIKISKNEYKNLSEDEYKTLAFRRQLPKAEKLFIEGLGYKKEPINPEDFEIIESKANRISIIGVESAKKVMIEDLYLEYSALLLDQYEDVMKQLPIFNNNIKLIDNCLKISKNMSQRIILSAKDSALKQSKELVIEYVEKEFTETEQLASMVTTLVLDGVEKEQQIELLVNQVTNLMLESGGI